MRHLFILVLAINFLDVLAETVFCGTPVTGAFPVSYCGATTTLLIVPNILGYYCPTVAGFIITVPWDSSTVSILTSIEVDVYSGYPATGYSGTGCAGRVYYCESTIASVYYSTTRYTVFVPPSVVTEMHTVALTPETETVTVTGTPSTVTVSVSVGSGDELTVYTTGPVAGTSTITYCA